MANSVNSRLLCYRLVVFNRRYEYVDSYWADYCDLCRRRDILVSRGLSCSVRHCVEGVYCV